MTPLRRRMTEDMLIRNLSPCTQQSNLDQVTRFANHFHQSPERLRPEQIRDYQLFLAAEKRLAPSSIGVAVSALRFLYGVTLGRDWEIREALPAPKQPSMLPVVPSPEEAVRFLDAVTPSGNRAVLSACQPRYWEARPIDLGEPPVNGRLLGLCGYTCAERAQQESARTMAKPRPYSQ